VQQNSSAVLITLYNIKYNFWLGKSVMIPYHDYKL